MKKHTIAGIGELLWDVLPEGEEIGGAPVNFSFHVNAFGARGIPISTVGHDDRGKRALGLLRQNGLNVAAVSISNEYCTGYVNASVDNEGAAIYSFPDDVAWDHLNINEYADSVKVKLDAICFGSLAQRSKVSRKAIYSFLDDLRPQTVRIFDINIRQNFFCREIIESSLKRANILKLNDEELVTIAGLLDLKGSAQDWLMALINRYDLGMVILTRGGNGSILTTPDGFSEHPGVDTQIVDTIGAGDSFTAATIIGYLHGFSLDEINEKANRIAACVCSQRGAMVPLPEVIRNLFL